MLECITCHRRTSAKDGAALGATGRAICRDCLARAAARCRRMPVSLRM
jgi:predicted CXXCH cytochrome family protein